MKELAIAILAAGESKRFGSIKQLAEFSGQPLLQHVINACRAIEGVEVYVILGAHLAKIEDGIDLDGVTLVKNGDWREGMASSIRSAVNAVSARHSALLLIAGDQIALNAKDLKNLINAWREDKTAIVAAEYGEKPGIPVIFPRASFAQLESLAGDHGAKSVLLHTENRLNIVAMPNAAIDIDTTADLDLIMH